MSPNLRLYPITPAFVNQMDWPVSTENDFSCWHLIVNTSFRMSDPGLCRSAARREIVLFSDYWEGEKEELEQ